MFGAWCGTGPGNGRGPLKSSFARSEMFHVEPRVILEMFHVEHLTPKVFRTLSSSSNMMKKTQRRFCAASIDRTLNLWELYI
jgi:hypothetical protein